MVRTLLGCALVASSIGCAGSEDEAPPIDAWCEAVWPGGGVDPDLQVWADGYLQHLAAGWNVDDAEVDAHVEVLSVEVWGTPTEYATVHARFTFDWVVFVVSAEGERAGRPATADEAADGFGSWWIPQIDPSAPPRSWGEVEAFVADCELELGVAFPDQAWCQSYATFDPDDDDQAGVRIDLDVDLGGGRTAEADIYVWGDEPDSCRTTQTPT